MTENEILLYRKVERELEERLKKGILKRGSRIPGERQLANELQVSRGTLRSALEELEKRNFLLRVPGKGTFIRDNGMTVRNITIGYLFPEPEISLVFQNYSNYAINSEVWRGIMECCAARGVVASFIPAQSHGSAKTNREILARLREKCSAVILPSHEFEELAELLTQENFPFCFTDLSERFPCIFYDVAGAAAAAASKLLSNRCRSVIMLSLNKSRRKNTFSTWETKVEIFKSKFKAAGFPIPEENIIELPCEDMEILSALRKILPEDRPLPDSFFTATPMVSFGLLHIAAERHWPIPEKVQIMGYANNMNIRRTIPELTYIELPHAAIGRRAVEHLTEKILSGREIPRKTILEATLIQGETTI